MGILMSITVDLQKLQNFLMVFTHIMLQLMSMVIQNFHILYVILIDPIHYLIILI